MKLRPYQEEAADFLYEHDRAMILAPVGAGKTAITLTAMRDLVAAEGIRFLVVAPLRVATSVWPVEAKKWAPSLRVRVAVGTPAQRKAALDSDADVVVINYDNLQWLGDLDLSDFTGVVFDELTRLKNPSGKRFHRAERGGGHAEAAADGQRVPVHRQRPALVVVAQVRRAGRHPVREPARQHHRRLQLRRGVGRIAQALPHAGGDG
jgi:hypothetical protein